MASEPATAFMVVLQHLDVCADCCVEVLPAPPERRYGPKCELVSVEPGDHAQVTKKSDESSGHVSTTWESASRRASAGAGLRHMGCRRTSPRALGAARSHVMRCAGRRFVA